MRKIAVIMLATAGILSLSACGGRIFFNEAEYWQRTDIRESAYMDVTHAQNLLHRDIAGCTAAVREQDSMAALRQAMPADGRLDPQSPEGQLAHWDAPARNGYLHNEHMPFHDFEGCMHHRGWERTAFLDKASAARSRKDYTQYVDPEARDRVNNTGNHSSYFQF